MPDGTERDLSEEEKKKVVRIIIKMIVVLYMKSLKNVGEEDSKRVEQDLVKKLGQKNDPAQGGKLISMLNRLADKYTPQKDEDGDVIMR